MSLDDIVQVNITAETTAPTRPGFGTPLIAAYHTRWTSDLVREYSKLSEMVDDGFLTTDAAYLCARSVWSQSPRPPKIKIGRRTRAFTQTVSFTPTVTTVGFVYNIDIGGLTATYTVVTDDTPTLISTGLVAAINALANTALHTATVVSAHFTVAAATAGALVNMANWGSALTVADITTDPGIVSDIADIVAEDDDWYGFLMDSQSKAEVVAAAADIEARIKLFVFNSSDSAIYDNASTTDVFYAQKTLNHARTIGLFSYTDLLSYSAAAWMGNRFPFDPGSDTWAYKTLKGVPTDNLSSGKVSAILAKRGSVYTEVAGVSVTQYGKSFSGEWADVTRFIDWLHSEIQIRVFTLLVNNQKVPFTDLGIDMVVSVINGALQAGVNAGGLSANPAPTCTAPKASEVDPATKADRILPNVKFTGTLAGAIHTLEIDGTLSV